MQQFLKCHRCGELRMIDLGLPADLCRRCLRALGFPELEDLTDRDLEVIENAWCWIEWEGEEWEDAVARVREQMEARHEQ